MRTFSVLSILAILSTFSFLFYSNLSNKLAQEAQVAMEQFVSSMPGKPQVALNKTLQRTELDLPELPMQDPAFYNDLVSQWHLLSKICQEENWGTIQDLLGKIQSQYWSKKLAIPVNKIYGFGSSSGFILLRKWKKEWQILTFVIQPLPNFPKEEKQAIRYESGYLVIPSERSYRLHLQAWQKILAANTPQVKDSDDTQVEEGEATEKKNEEEAKEKEKANKTNIAQHNVGAIAPQLPKKEETTPRKVRLSFSSAKTQKSLDPESVEWNGQTLEENEFLAKPGQYEVEVIAYGHEVLKESLTVKPGSEEIVFHLELQERKKRKFFLTTSYEIPPEEEDIKIQAKLINLMSREIYYLENKPTLELLPEMYLLELKREGYETHIMEVDLTEGNAPYYYHHKFIPLLREVKVKVYSNYGQKRRLNPDEVILGEDTSPLQARPGSHNLTIRKYGYKTLSERILIKASAKPYKLFRNIEVLSRAIRLEFLDEKSRLSVYPDQVLFNNVAWQQSAKPSLASGDFTNHAPKFFPGRYLLEIKAEGYYNVRQNIEIPVGNSLYHLPVLMLPKKHEKSKRKILFNIPEKIKPYKILVNGQKHKENKEFAAPQLIKVQVLFENYKTYEQDIWLERRESPKVIEIPIESLQTIDFSVKNFITEIDDISYTYKFEVHGEPIESHHISIQAHNGQIFTVSLAIPKDTKEVKIYQGFYYDVYPITALSKYIYQPKKIDLLKLKEHFASIRTKLGRIEAEQKISSFFDLQTNVAAMKKEALYLRKEMVTYLNRVTLSWHEQKRMEKALLYDK